MRLTLSCGDYDRTRPLIDDAVATPGLNLKVIPLPSAERHTRFVTNFEFDVCELQIALYLGLKSRGVPITAVPVFLHRRFNHSCVMVSLDSDIVRPEDLREHRVGVHAHFNPIALWIRGVLQHEFDVPPSSIQWVADGAEHVAGWSPPSWLRIERAPAGRKMQSLLETGELDAQIQSDNGAEQLLSTKPCGGCGPTIAMWRQIIIVVRGFSPFAMLSSSRTRCCGAIPRSLRISCALSKRPNRAPTATGPTIGARIWPGSEPNRKRRGHCWAPIPDRNRSRTIESHWRRYWITRLSKG